MAESTAPLAGGEGGPAADDANGYITTTTDPEGGGAHRRSTIVPSIGAVEVFGDPPPTAPRSEASLVCTTLPGANANANANANATEGLLATRSESYRSSISAPAARDFDVPGTPTCTRDAVGNNSHASFDFGARGPGGGTASRSITGSAAGLYDELLSEDARDQLGSAAEPASNDPPSLGPAHLCYNLNAGTSPRMPGATATVDADACTDLSAHNAGPDRAWLAGSTTPGAKEQELFAELRPLDGTRTQDVPTYYDYGLGPEQPRNRRAIGDLDDFSSTEEIRKFMKSKTMVLPKIRSLRMHSPGITLDEIHASQMTQYHHLAGPCPPNLPPWPPWPPRPCV